MVDSRFLRACQRLPVDATPIWLMRQAGRFLPEYRAVRAKHTMLDVIHTPELAALVTLQPLRRFELDAGIIFSDILPLLGCLGMQVAYEEGKGPVIDPPIRRAAEVAALSGPTPEEHCRGTLAAIRLVRAERPQTPLIGFSGAPFTLACYALEGETSRLYLCAKRFMLDAPQAWHLLMERLSQLVGDYLLLQAQAGAQALQLFDSWVGILAPEDYVAYVLPHMRALTARVAACGLPVISFGVGTSGFLEHFAEVDAQVIGIDWQQSLATAWQRIGVEKFAVQGNLDPAVLLGPWEEVRARADLLLGQAASASSVGHIFNLGHGVLPETDPDLVARLVDCVHLVSWNGDVTVPGPG